MKLDQRCQPIELLLSDVDGVLTDGGVVFNNHGIESKQFHVRDGMGIKLAHMAGLRFGVVTSRNSHVVKVRAAELGIDIVRQGTHDKLQAVQEIARGLSLELHQVGYIGDDLPDLAVLKAVGLGVAVADAPPELALAAAYTTKLPGGRGAVRETVELILKAKRLWAEIVARFG